MSDMIEKIKRKIKDFLLKFGTRMLSEREYRELRLQRNSAIKKMTGEFNKIDFITGLSSVIFSIAENLIVINSKFTPRSLPYHP